MISFEHKAVFVKIPKTAGTSISVALNCLHVSKPHRNILEVREIIENARLANGLPQGVYLSPDWFDRFYKFGFVRNPWSRVVSLYKRKEGIQMAERMSFEKFVDWINYASDTCIHPSQHKNQLDWFTDKQGNILVDFVGKFENLNNDWEKVCQHLSIRAPLPHLRKNPSNKKHYTEYYTDRTRDIIREKFIVDIEHFGYGFQE